MALLDETGLEPAHDRLFENGQGEGVEDLHVGGHDQKDDIEGPGDIETELDLGMGYQTLTQAVALVRDVALQLDMDHRRQGMPRRRIGQNRRLGGNGALGPQTPDATGHRRGRPADLLGQAIRRLHIVLLQAGEQGPVQLIQFAHLPQPAAKFCQFLASRGPRMPEFLIPSKR